MKKSHLHGDHCPVSSCSTYHLSILIVLLFAVMAISALLYSGQLSAGEEPYVAGEILVKYVPGVNPALITDFETKYSLMLLNDFSHIGIRHYKLPDTYSLTKAIEEFKKIPIVEYAEPNYYRQQMFVPTDPEYDEQWALNNTGQLVNGKDGPSDIDIDWSEAMDIFHPNGNVIVAILDSGISLTHPEFLPMFWLNLGEDPGDNIDNDGNGYIDDYVGWDFFDNDKIALDENGHGTLVASIIAGAIHNGEGGVGVAPTAKIMPLRVANDLGILGTPQVADSNVIASSTYAANNGARIINASFGGGGFSASMLAQIQWLDSQGVLLVAAAGNGGSDRLGDNNDTTSIYPASYQVNNIIAVSAIDRSGDLSFFSNYGSVSVDLAAPGTDIYGADIKRIDVALETFEGGLAGWTQGGTFPRWSLTEYPVGSGNDVISDSLGGDYLPNTNTWISSPIQVPSNGPLLTYNIGSSLSLFFDFLLVEISTNGTDWNIVSAVGPTPTFVFGTKRVDLSPYAGSPAILRFRLVSDGALQAAGVIIDNVAISEVGVFDYDGTQYQYNDGTSFSAPLVSGVAAMIMAQRPDLTHRQVRQLILDNVVKTGFLNGKVATGGQLNAHAALAAAIAYADTPPSSGGSGGGGGCTVNEKANIDPVWIVLLVMLGILYLKRRVNNHATN